MLKRHPNWPELLAGKIDAARTSPFIWGENDCCLFAADCVEIMTGIDLAGDYRNYKTKAEALRLLKKYGGVAGIAEAIAKQHSILEIQPLNAQRGDVCLFDIGRGDTLGVVAGEHIFAPGPDGLVGFPLEQAVRAWRIG